MGPIGGCAPLAMPCRMAATAGEGGGVAMLVGRGGRFISTFPTPPGAGGAALAGAPGGGGGGPPLCIGGGAAVGGVAEAGGVADAGGCAFGLRRLAGG